MAHSNSTLTVRPVKPSENFPLFPHGNGQWCKKVNGKLFYFGPWADPSGALARWDQQKDDLLAGRKPPARVADPKPTLEGKPRKPRRDWPLFAHNSGRWAAKIRGKLHYFGPWGDPEGALQAYLDQKDDLMAGRRPRAKGDGITVRDVCNHFLNAKRHKVNTGEIRLQTWNDYDVTCNLVCSVFGKDRLASDLRPEDFNELREFFRKGRAAEALGNQIQRVRCMLKFAWDNRLVTEPIATGSEFKRPSKTAQRRERQGEPPRLFTAQQICELHDAASIPMQAMILLATNTGTGNTDLARLRQWHLDLKKGILDYPRPKSTIERRATLWGETVAAIKLAISNRPEPENPADADLVFLTRCGVPWVRDEGSHVDAIAQEFDKLVGKDALKIKRKGLGFYTLRRVFETIGGETGDQAAVDRCMGHADASMAGRYRQWKKDKREDERLRRVTDHVRQWLLTVEKPADEQEQA